ncbi:FAD-dependent monooxygenase [Catellatospora bangladeshensis]|uniref:FAD-dependent monooxygenase n=1 Tax=Catellatospora bangladeshensis TaxID=310355 RepID=UPI00360E55FE
MGVIRFCGRLLLPGRHRASTKTDLGGGRARRRRGGGRGGPTGLLLAAELRLAGVDVLVLEQRAEPDPVPRANGLVGQVVEVMYHRGLYRALARHDRGPAAALRRRLTGAYGSRPARSARSRTPGSGWTCAGSAPTRCRCSPCRSCTWSTCSPGTRAGSAPTSAAGTR